MCDLGFEGKPLEAMDKLYSDSALYTALRTPVEA
jgi:hypothetical protein